MKKDDVISQEKIDLLNQRLDEAAIQDADFRQTVPMIKLTLSTIEGKTEMQVGALILSLFNVCCIENQIALMDQLREQSMKAVCSAIREQSMKAVCSAIREQSMKAVCSAISDHCPELKNIIDEIMNKKNDDDTDDE